jgi:hypothetical protein
LFFPEFFWGLPQSSFPQAFLQQQNKFSPGFFATAKKAARKH